MKLIGALLLCLLAGFNTCASIPELDSLPSPQQPPGLFANLPSELFEKILALVYAAEKMVLKQTCMFFDDHLRSDFRTRFQEVIVRENQLPFWQLSLYKVFSEWVKCGENGEDANRLLALLKKHRHYPLLERIASGQPLFTSSQFWRVTLIVNMSFDHWLRKQDTKIDVDLAKIIIAYGQDGEITSDIISTALEIQVPIRLFSFMLSHLTKKKARDTLLYLTMKRPCTRAYAIEGALFLLKHKASEPEVLAYVLQNRQHIHTPFKTILEELPVNDKMQISLYAAREIFSYGNSSYHKLFLKKFVHPDVLRMAAEHLRDSQVLIDVIMESFDQSLENQDYLEVAAEIFSSEEQMISILEKCNPGGRRACSAKTIDIFFTGKFGERATMLLFHKFPGIKIYGSAFEELFTNRQSGYIDWSYDTLALIGTHALGSTSKISFTQFKALPEDLPDDILIAFTRFNDFSAELFIELIRRRMSSSFLKLILRSTFPVLNALGAGPEIIDSMRAADYDEETTIYFSRVLMPFRRDAHDQNI